MAKHELANSGNVTSFWLDFGERIGFQVLYAGVSEAIIELSNVSQSWAPIIIVGLNIVKSLITKKLNGSAGVVITPSVPPAAPPNPESSTPGA